MDPSACSSQGTTRFNAAGVSSSPNTRAAVAFPARPAHKYDDA